MEVTRKQLEEWYKTMTVLDLMEKLGYGSANSVYRLLRKAGIERKGSDKYGRRNVVTIVDGE